MDQIRQTAPAETAWLWEGYLAKGNMTLLSSQWKCGKTTLTSILMSRLGTGGMLAGLPVCAGRAVVVSEEDPGLWKERCERLAIGPQVNWLCRPFRGRPGPQQWLDLIDWLASRRRDGNLDLAVIDPLATFLPRTCENDAGALVDALLPLHRLTQLGTAVLLLHHTRKRASAPGLAARGGRALTEAVDIVLELSWHGPPLGGDRRRRLFGMSRHPQTPRRRLIELTPDGTDYVSLGEYHDVEFQNGYAVLLAILENGRRPMSRAEILQAWPAHQPRPEESTLWRWLDRAVKDGALRQDGRGRRQDPFRYWLPGHEESNGPELSGGNQPGSR